MAKNLIPEICKMLGVELGEEFKVDRYEYNWLTFKFAENMLMSRSDLKGAEWGITYVILSELLVGEVEIVKLPWKPKKGEDYYTFGGSDGIWRISQQHWTCHPFDLAVLAKGWAYRTREEAESALPKVAAEMGVKFI